jgi:uncharacterized repeat protein (TIGR03803 family)
MRLAGTGTALALAAVVVLALITSQSAGAQTFTTLYSFCAQSGCSDGDSPWAPLMQATDGNLYGTTAAGGEVNTYLPCYDNGCGTLFNITTSGTLTTLVEFNSFDGFVGFGPDALVQGTDGNFYGTTGSGGGNSFCNGVGCGTVFKFSPNGALTTLYIFCSQSNCADGASPSALVQGTDGNFYGTTDIGGAYSTCQSFCGGGTVFKITPSGTLTTLYSFCAQSGCPDGAGPAGALIQATDGNLYGTTVQGGANSSGCSGCGGTIFKMTPSGTLTSLYSFSCSNTGTQIICPDGAAPETGLIQATDGNFYGTTLDGGANSSGCSGCGGTIFKITPTGALTMLYSFCAQSDCADGSDPTGSLIQATDGNFYGTTVYGGAYSTCTGGTCGPGTVFEITPGGTLTTLHSFSGPDGTFPRAGVVQDTDGNLYGTTSGGGVNFTGTNGGQGTVFSLDVSLGPFVKTLPTSGPALGAVMILGTDLTGATSVGFNGVTATFTVASASLITTTVPLGATIGPVTVITPNGTLTSNVPFTLTTGNTPSTTTLASSLNPSTFNQSVTFTATVAGADGGTPTGTVTFTADGTNVLGMIALSGGQAAVSTFEFSAGAHSIVASYGGDGNYQPSTSATLIQTVQMASSSLALASSVDPSAYNQAVIFTASISPQFGGSATGGVRFYNSTGEIGRAGVSGNKARLSVSTLPVGSSGIQAIYSGDSNVAGNTSPVLFQSVKKASTTTAVTSSPYPAYVAQTITFTARVASQYQGALSGSVEFRSGSVSLGSATLANGQAGIETSFNTSGDYSITAEYLGDGNNTGSLSPKLTQAVDKYPSKTSVASSLNPSLVGQEVTFTATVETNGSPTGTVTFTAGDTILGAAALAGKTASLSTSALAAGTYQVKAAYSGDGAVNGSTSTALKQVVNAP